MAPERFSTVLRAGAAELWEAQHAHPFLRGVADGTLPRAVFTRYVRQDHAFLVGYARVLALAAARAPRLDWMRRFAALAHATLEEEMELHRGLAAAWGISPAELDAETPLPALAAYVDFLLATATVRDFPELTAALLPCMWGYSELGRRLAAEGGSPDPGLARWVESYADPDFAELAEWCRTVCDAIGAGADGDTRTRMAAAFRTSSAHELAFWEAAWRSGR